MPKAVAVLEVMWDWDARTSSAGYAETAPTHFRINGNNFTGRRLYDWLGHYDLLVTNACPQLVSSAKGRGKPDKKWLADNLEELKPFELLLVCGKVAQQTYWLATLMNAGIRVIECPHPAARIWTRHGLAFMRRLVQEGKHSLRVQFRDGRLVAEDLFVPF